MGPPSAASASFFAQTPPPPDDPSPRCPPLPLLSSSVSTARTTVHERSNNRITGARQGSNADPSAIQQDRFDPVQKRAAPVSLRRQPPCPLWRWVRYDPPATPTSSGMRLPQIWQAQSSLSITLRRSSGVMSLRCVLLGGPHGRSGGDCAALRASVECEARTPQCAGQRSCSLKPGYFLRVSRLLSCLESRFAVVIPSSPAKGR